MSGSKHDLLTEQDVCQYVLPRRVLAVLDECGRYFGITRSELRVLDWGCGRGMRVAKLLEMGFDAFGVDVDPEPMGNGRPLFLSRGYDPDERLNRISADDCRSSFPEGFFHVVLSDQVFEHLAKLDTVACEVARVTMPGGKGLHIFPSKWGLIEPHLFLPCIHWLPKNWIRYFYLRLKLKRVPVWDGMQSMTASERANVYFNYSVGKTFYRPCREIRKTLLKHGLEGTFHADGQPGRRLKLCFPLLLLSNRFAGWFFRWYSNTFHGVILTTTRVARIPCSQESLILKRVTQPG